MQRLPPTVSIVSWSIAARKLQHSVQSHDSPITNERTKPAWRDVREQAQPGITAMRNLLRHCCVGSVLLMRQTAEGRLEDQGRALIVQVGGDTMHGLAMLLDGSTPTRPSTLDLLWTVHLL